MGRSPYVASSTMRIFVVAQAIQLVHQPVDLRIRRVDLTLNRIRRLQTQGAHAIVSGISLT